MDLGLGTTLLAGDPRLIDHIVGEVKSQGIFDQFRKECIADVDTKPAYQNLRTRVEGSVNSFLNKQIWRPELNKNQLRETLRKQISDAPYLDAGVERIVDQVVNPKVFSVFMPQIEDVVYKFLGMERPKNRERDRNGPCNLKDLLPKDLDPVSPESDKNSLKDISLESVDADMHIDEERKSGTPEPRESEKELPKQTAEESEDGPRLEDAPMDGREEEDKRRMSKGGEELEDDQKQVNLSMNSTKSEDKEEEEEDSPTFEPIDVIHPNESNDSHLSGISELTSHGSRSPNFCANDFSRDHFDFSNQDSRLSKVSSDSRLSIVTDFGSSNHASTPILEDSNKSESRNAKEHFKAIRDESSKSKSSAKCLELEKSGNSKPSEAKIPRNNSSKENSRDATDGSNLSKEKKESSKSRNSRSRESKTREKSSSSSNGKHSRSSKGRRSDSERSRSESKGDKTSKSIDNKPLEAGGSSSLAKQEEEKQPKDLKDIYKEKIRELREKKELTEKEKLKDKDKDKEKSSRDRKESTSKDRKSSREKDHRSSSSSSKSSRQEKSKSESGGSTKDSRSRSKEHHRSSSSSSKKPREESKKKSSKSTSSSSSSSSSDKLKKDSKKERSSSETSSGKDKRRRDEKKSSKSSKDDHSSLRKNSSDRRSTDRDGSNGSNSKNGSHVNHSNNSGSNNGSNNTGNNSNNNNNSTDKNSSSNKESNNSTSSEENIENLELEANKLPTENIGYVQELLSRPERVELGGLEMTLPLKKRPFNTELEPEVQVKKPRFAENFDEAKDLMKILNRLEKKVEVPDQDVEEEELENSSNFKDQLEAVPDEERVQIIEVPDEDYEEPYPEMNLNLEDASVIFSSEDVISSDKKMVTKLTVMENAIRQSLSEMISDTNLSNSGGSDRLDKEESPEIGVEVEEKPLELQTELETGVEKTQAKAGIEETQEKAGVEETQEKAGVAETEGKILESLLQLPRKEEEGKKEKETEDWTSNPEEPAGNLVKDPIPIGNMDLEKGVSKLEAPESDEEDCLYLIEDTERLKRFESFLSSLRREESSQESLEEILESFGGEVIRRERSSMAAPALPIKRKSSSSPLSDILLNRNNNNDGLKAMEVQETDGEEDQNSVTKRKKVGRPKKQLQLQQLRPASLPQGLFNGENFVMPLSPESDVSATSEKAALQPLRDDRRQRNNQRYSSDDLYKPRPLFLGSTRRNRKSNQA